jgi:hypothetical protein
VIGGSRESESEGVTHLPAPSRLADHSCRGSPGPVNQVNLHCTDGLFFTARGLSERPAGGDSCPESRGNNRVKAKLPNHRCKVEADGRRARPAPASRAAATSRLTGLVSQRPRRPSCSSC